MSYSQRDEERIILKYAPENGVFCDCGAFSPKVFSNTRALYEKGWSGILVEPSPECFLGLLKEYANDPRITLVNALLTAQDSGLTKFYSSPDAVGTACEANYKTWKDHASFAPIYIQSLPVNRMIEALKLAHLDFISIDTEGSSFEILQALDLKALGCKMICVEYDKHEAAMRAHLSKLGFGIVHQTAENLIATRS